MGLLMHSYFAPPLRLCFVQCLPSLEQGELRGELLHFSLQTPDSDAVFVFLRSRHILYLPTF